MTLNGQQLLKLQNAILSGFNASDLEQLVRFELNERLDSLVATHGAFTNVVFELIQWAETRGRTAELIRALQRARPNNADIQAAAAELLPSPTTGQQPASGTARLDGPRRARLRAALIDQFPTRAALKILLDDSLSVNLDSISTASNLTETVFDLIQRASIDPQGYLLPLLSEAVTQRPNSTELKSLKTELFGN
jgi:hypothetical protein